MAAAQGTSAAVVTAPRHATTLARLAVFVGTVAAIVALAVLPLLTPFFVHPALDASGSARLLGVEPAAAHGLSDRSIQELLLGPASFAFEGQDGRPFYDADERHHLADARTLLWLLLLSGLISLAAVAALLGRASSVARARLWRAVSAAGAASALTVLVLGIASVVAFDGLFDIFHRIFFPGGNWAFDPSRQRLVQLYPLRFWQIASATLGALVLLLGAGAWLLGRIMARRSQVRGQPAGWATRG